MKSTLISSRDNANFKLWMSLLDSRGLKKHEQFILSGRKTVPEALTRKDLKFTTLVYTEDMKLPTSIPSSIKGFTLAKSLFKELDILGTESPLLVGPIPVFKTADLNKEPKGLEVICALGDPNNLGALLRSAVAFGAQKIILLKESAHPFHPRCLRAAANAIFNLEFCEGPSIRELDSLAGEAVALDTRGENWLDYQWPKDIRLILGEEGQGIPKDLKATRLTIPTTGKVESLNATVAASLALFTYFQKNR